MSVYVSALVVRGRFIVTVAALVVAAMVVVSGRAEAAGVSAPVLAEGAGMGAQPSGEVRGLQRALRRGGYDLGASGVDGRFGRLTAAAVRRLQARRGLAVDGVVGRDTRATLGLARRVGLAPRRRSHTERSVTASPARGSKVGAARGSKVGAARGSTRARRVVVVGAARSNTIAASGAGEDRSRDAVASIVLWGAFAGFAALALGGLWRLRSRVRRPGPGTGTGTGRAREDVGGGSVHGAVNGFGAGPVSAREPVIGYVTTCSEEWSDSDEASAAAIEATCERSDWGLFEIVQDRQNGKTLDRPGLTYALEQIARGQARGLVVSDLQRLSRSPDDLGALMAWFRDADARLVALDLDLDTGTPAGRQVARTLIALGHAARGGAQAPQRGGSDAPAPVHGRPAVRDRPELMQRIAAMRSASMTLWQIADQLNAEGIPTLRGGRQWRPSSIQAALGYKRPGPHDRLPALQNRAGNGG